MTTTTITIIGSTIGDNVGALVSHYAKNNPLIGEIILEMAHQKIKQLRADVDKFTEERLKTL